MEEMNGRPRLACMTLMSVFTPEETLTITPMRTFPVIRDLVTDVSFNYAKALQIRRSPRTRRSNQGEFRMQQVDVNRSQEFRKCIECFLCQNTCHVIRDHTENERAFAGPRFLMRVAELEMHPADTADRREIAQDDFGLGYCNITKCCTEVCPEHIKITDNALIPMKERVVGRKYDPLVWLGDKIGRRTRKDAEDLRQGLTQGSGSRLVKDGPADGTGRIAGAFGYFRDTGRFVLFEAPAVVPDVQGCHDGRLHEQAVVVRHGRQVLVLDDLGEYLGVADRGGQAAVQGVGVPVHLAQGQDLRGGLGERAAQA